MSVKIITLEGKLFNVDVPDGIEHNKHAPCVSEREKTRYVKHWTMKPRVKAIREGVKPIAFTNVLWRCLKCLKTFRTHVK